MQIFFLVEMKKNAKKKPSEYFSAFPFQCVHSLVLIFILFVFIVFIGFRNYINIDFASLRLNLCLPPTVKCKNGAIRGMWLKFDHFSDFCPSYEMPGKTACHFDLSQAAKIEWKKRKELEKENTPEPEPKSKSHQTNADGAVPFDNFELISMPIVDVDKLYLDYVTELMQQDRLRKGVKALNLKEFEINLRQYRIVGGVYCLDYFEQPEQSVKLSSKSFLRTSKSMSSS